MSKTIPIGERLAAHSTIVASGCWLWTGAQDRHGYGHIKVSGKLLRAHRVSYEYHVGPIADGMVIDHLCRVRHCINPAHLEVVTVRENTVRSPWNSPDVCRKGHARTEDSTYLTPSGNRSCKTCHRGASADYRRRQLANP